MNLDGAVIASSAEVTPDEGVNNSIPFPVGDKFLEYCLSIGLFQCSCTPRLDNLLLSLFGA